MVRLRRLLLPGLLGMAVYYGLFGGEYSVFEVSRTRSQIDAETSHLVELRSRVAALRARAEALENDPATVERIAREDFGMIREGEVLYRFVEGAEAPEESDSRR